DEVRLRLGGLHLLPDLLDLAPLAPFLGVGHVDRAGVLVGDLVLVDRLVVEPDQGAESGDEDGRAADDAQDELLLAEPTHGASSPASRAPASPASWVA